MKNKAGWVATLGIIAWGSGSGPIAHAQEGEAFSQTFSINQRLNVNDNLGFDPVSDGTSVTSTTGLRYSLVTETRNQRLSFSLGSTLEGGYFASSDNTDLSFVSPNARLNYSTEGSRSAFSFAASARRTDVTTLFLDPELAEEGDDPDATFDPEDLILDDGTRQVVAVSTGLTTGRDTPVQLSFSASFTDRQYQDTTDPALVDSRNVSGSARATFVLNPTMNLSTFYTVSHFEEDNAEDRELDRHSAGVSLSYAVSETTQVNASVSANRVEETELAVTSVTEGAGFSLSVDRELPNGALGLSFDRSISANGANDSVRVSRRLALPDGGLFVSLGVVDGAASDRATTTNIRYNRELATGSFSASLSQNLSTDDDEDVLRTRVAVGYNQTINNVSSIGASLSIADSNVFGAGADTRRTSASVTYTRQMAQDWALQAGYTFQKAEEEGAADRSSNAVFVGFNKTFDTR